MKVLLIKDVKNLGKAGEIKEVKPGFGQNFLVAKGLAKNATDEVIETWKKEQADIAAAAAAEIANLKDIKAKLENVKTKITKKVGANGQLFGAITKEEISAAIKEQHGLEIDKKHLELKNPIKTTGIFDIDAKMGHGIHASVNLEIEAE